MTGALQTASGRTSRRAVLVGGAAGVLGSMAGCVEQVTSSLNGLGDDRLAISISTLPADGDREGVQIARTLRGNLEAVGATVSIDMRRRSAYRRSILLDHDFDIFIGELNDIHEPDTLFGALHSSYAEEAGEQNPFGFANRTFDRLLEAQRTADPDSREDAVADLLLALADEQPFVPLCRPTDVRVVRTDRFEGWSGPGLERGHGYLDLEQTGTAGTINGVVTDSGPTQNLNPLTASYRNRGTIMDLIYDSPVVVTDGEVQPWLAASREWDDGTLTLELRPNLRFHDGVALTADDIAFTYRFLADTSLGRTEVPSPAPRYRREVDLFESVEVVDDETLTLETEAAPAVAEPALTLPVLPEHVWTQHLEEYVAGLDLEDDETIASAFRQGRHGLLTLENVPAIGSGPYRFDERGLREYLSLTRFEDHFTLRSDADLPAPVATDFEITTAPSSATAIEQVQTGVTDVTMSPIDAYAIDLLEIDDTSNVDRVEGPNHTAYIVGFNTQRQPFSDPYFREIVARLLDKGEIVEQVFQGHAEPAAAPLTTPWLPPDLRWDGTDPVTPFLGTDGDLDAPAARTALRRAGYEYVDGRLQTR